MRSFFMRSWTIVCLSAALVALFAFESKALDTQNQSLVRVRVIKDADRIVLKIKNLVAFDRTGARVTLAKTNPWAEISLSKSDEENLNFPIDIYGSEILSEGKNLPSPLRISIHQGQVSGIASVKLSDYLLGVLHREMSGLWPMEAMKAQAVATRSYSVAQMKARAQDEFDLEGSVLDQDFEWVPERDRKKTEILNWQKALDQTRDMVLVASDGQTLKSFYHADCGGETTVPELVWGPKGEFQSVKDPVCEKRKKNRWQ